MTRRATFTKADLVRAILEMKGPSHDRPPKNFALLILPLVGT